MAVRSKGTGEQAFPSWTELLTRAADRLDAEGKPSVGTLVRSLVSINGPGDLLNAAKRAKESLGSSWYEFLKDQFDVLPSEVLEESLALARAIWDINNLVITTNFDRVLEWVAPDGNPSTWNIEAKAEMAMAHRNAIRRPTVWHLHGHIDDAANIILTPDGYDTLYGASGTEVRYAAALETLREFLTSHTILFIGFSLEDERFGQQLRYLDRLFAGTSGPHYVILPEAERDRIRTLGFSIELLTVTSHGDPLVELVQMLGRIVSRPRSFVSEEVTLVDMMDSVPLTNFNPANPIVLIPFRPKGDRVIGRTNALQRVRDQLTSQNRTSVGQTAAFQGIGGLGKTQLAVEYAWKYKNEYAGGIIWINADHDIPAQLIDLAVEARWVAPQADRSFIFEIAVNRLRSVSDCLIIFDNVERTDDIQPYLPIPTTNPHILITSRTEHVGFIPVELDSLTVAESVDLLLQESNRASLPEDERQAASDIALQLGGLPLALELAGAYLRHRPLSLRFYADSLTANLRAALPPKFLSSYTRHEADIYATLKIGEEIISESPLLRPILDLFAWSGTAAISDSLLRAMIGDVSELELLDALGLAEALRLIKRDSQESAYSMHRLVREVRRYDSPVESIASLAEVACGRLAKWFATRRLFTRDAREFVRQVDHLYNWRAVAENLDLAVAPRLIWLESYPFFFEADYKSALAQIERAHEVTRTSRNDDLDLRAHLLNDKSVLALRRGDEKRAVEYMQQAMRIRTTLHGKEHEEIAFLYSNAAELSKRRGKLTAAVQYAENARSLFIHLRGEGSPETAIAEIRLASVLRAMGNLKRAIHYANAAIAKLQTVFPDGDERTGYAFETLASCYTILCEHELAIRSQHEALGIFQETVGEAHHQYTEAQIHLGDTLIQADKPELAAFYLEQTLPRVRSNHAGVNPTDHVRAFKLLAQAYKALGRTSEALKLMHDELNRLPSHHAARAELKQAIREFFAPRPSSSPSLRGRRRR